MYIIIKGYLIHSGVWELRTIIKRVGRRVSAEEIKFKPRSPSKRFLSLYDVFHREFEEEMKDYDHQQWKVSIISWSVLNDEFKEKRNRGKLC